jgi:guanyl-specific ribonuclease Sa
MTEMIWIDDRGARHTVMLISTGGPYAYVSMSDGSSFTVFRSQLHAPPATRSVPRTIKTPAPYRTPKQRRESGSDQ